MIIFLKSVLTVLNYPLTLSTVKCCQCLQEGFTEWKAILANKPIMAIQPTPPKRTPPRFPLIRPY